MLADVLSKNNEHIRDKNIIFYDEGHKYDILTDRGNKYTSVTTFLHSHFPKFDSDKIINNIMNGKNWNDQNKYWGKTKEEIKQMWNMNGSTVAQAGTELHFRIECFMNNPDISFPYNHKNLLDYYESNKKETIEPLEWEYFIHFVNDHPAMKPYRTEWIIYHEDKKLAGSIDMVYENEDGTLNIYDWKRSKEITRINKWNKYAITREICEIPDTNFWHYALQLNTYKMILEEKYNKVVKDLYLVRLHPDAEENNYELIKIPDLQAELKKII
jgi:ATP-dependent exoDNAse (exonuclease V) beta subunit